MEDLFREMLAPLSPTSPNLVSASLSLPPVSAAQNTETEAAGGAAPQIGVGAGAEEGAVAVGSGLDAGMSMEMVDLGLGIDMNMEAGIGGEQWATSELEMQRILETLSDGYEAYRQQQVLDLDSAELGLGWDHPAFGAQEGLGVGVDVF
jgi:hypothetical protein